MYSHRVAERPCTPGPRPITEPRTGAAAALPALTQVRGVGPSGTEPGLGGLSFWKAYRRPTLSLLPACLSRAGGWRGAPASFCTRSQQTPQSLPMASMTQPRLAFLQCSFPPVLLYLPLCQVPCFHPCLSSPPSPVLQPNPSPSRRAPVPFIAQWWGWGEAVPVEPEGKQK